MEPAGPDTSFRAACTGLPAGLYRLYACGVDGQLLLGVTEDGRLHRRYSAAMTAPLGAVTRCTAQPVQTAPWRPPHPIGRLPLARSRRCAAASGGRQHAACRTLAAGGPLPADGAVLLRRRDTSGGPPHRPLHFFRRLDAAAAAAISARKKIAPPSTKSGRFMLYCCHPAVFCRKIRRVNI